MTLTIDAVVMLLAGILSGLGGWVFLINGRLSGHERGCIERQLALDERHINIEKALDHINIKLDRLMGNQK